MRRGILAVAIWVSLGVLGSPGVAQDTQAQAAQWWTSYSGAEANGPHVLGYWKFDAVGKEATRDASAHKHLAALRGANWNADGRFGGCLESAAGYPVADESHGLHVTRSAVLSPSGAFTVEMWIKPKGEQTFLPTLRPVLLDMKYVPDNHTGFLLSLTKAAQGATRRGTHSNTNRGDDSSQRSGARRVGV